MLALIAALALSGEGALSPSSFILYPSEAQQGPKPKPLPQNQPGYGDPVAKDARITVHFSATTADGQTIADTETRGMAFTFLMDQETVEPFWHNAVRGMRAGGVKTVKVLASAAGVVIPNDPTISVTIKLVRVAPL